MSRFVYRVVGNYQNPMWSEIVDTQTGQVVDTAMNVARARLLVIRYNREAASGEAAEA